MISVRDYVGPHADSQDWTKDREIAAEMFLGSVNELLIEAEAHGIALETNPRTGTLVSGLQYGGFRPQDCPEGKPDSSHKEGRGVDVYDQSNALDKWITDGILEHHGLYREHPDDTPGWTHLTDRAPASGKRSFHP